MQFSLLYLIFRYSKKRFRVQGYLDWQRQHFKFDVWYELWYEIWIWKRLSLKLHSLEILIVWYHVHSFRHRSYIYSLSCLFLHITGTCITFLCLLQLIGGAVTTSTFTLMMQCSQGAKSHTQATHYTALATLEVMGKLSFMAVIGALTDYVGYGVVFGLFIGLSLVPFPLLRCRRAFYHNTI